ncbi:MAG: dual specificity protein phosphatase family protein [Lentisphaerae bacterium]|jgi:protein tyrosine/serine phosphatase|nr:dual specificity protein phosphatase family protein [Lentisphaerota bacterium]
MSKNSCLNLALVLLLLAAGCKTRPMTATADATAPVVVDATSAAVSNPSRPAQWAQPLSHPGLPNFHQVNDALYRSAQPSAEGYATAAKLGIKAVLRLRSASDKSKEDQWINAAGLALHDVPMAAWNINDNDVIRAMRILQHARHDGPFLVHCLHGADRTGLVCAVYRVLFENWNREDAIAELTGGGFGFHPLFANIPHYVRTFDVEKIKAALQAEP